MKRESKSVPSALEHRLNSYALAASAAGVGLLALVQPAEGKIVYTKANVTIGYGGVGRYTLDLNHDGVPDFYIGVFSNSCTTECEALLSVTGKIERAIKGNRRGSFWAYALRQGAKIGGTKEFDGYFYALMAGYDNALTTTKFGYWANGGKGVKNRYLGLRFPVKLNTYYAWARLSVRFSKKGGRDRVTATLTGYAYETVPGKPIIAGKTHGKDVVTVEPATLGHLAQGASAIPAWRMRESIGARQ
jgi:hypothetical protein